VGGLLNSLISSVTGTDPSTLSADLNAGEQYAVLAAEVLTVLLVIMVIELMLILFELRGK
jgi:hypothetical protein